MINDQLISISLIIGHNTGHKFERFIVKIFGAIENILSAGTEDDCPVKYFFAIFERIINSLSWSDHHINGQSFWSILGLYRYNFSSSISL